MTFDKEKILHYCNSISENTLMQTLNIKFTDAGPDFLTATMPVNPSVHQPMGLLHGGASVALRKLVEQARRSSLSADLIRQAQNTTFRFMTAMTGNQPGYEEAVRALFATDRARFDALIASWPEDIRAHLQGLANSAFQSSPAVEPAHV